MAMVLRPPRPGLVLALPRPVVLGDPVVVVAAVVVAVLLLGLGHPPVPLLARTIMFGLRP